ncbi:MAG TPA: hypothetical protein DCZ91_23470 [Lachnospiraceae bacterium]|nr:hypothetical protein [Lachnospiraceae bacterium]
MDLRNANEPQKAAIMHLRGPCLVLAGPGSGKTYTITNRILYLLEQGIPPESILVITFMKEAALSMQNRFQEMAAAGTASSGRFSAEHKPTYPVNFGTFHSVFYHILKASNALKSTKLLSNSEKKNLIFPILKTYGKQQNQAGTAQESQEEAGSLSDDAAQILSAIGYYKNTMQMTAACEKVPVRWQAHFEAICREYALAVKKLGRLDFDDMLYECRTLLQENGSVRNYWQNRFRFILIDEFQDINPVQYEAVKLLAAQPYNIFAVGDDDQAIYGFRGSQPECLKRFEAEFHARQLLLDVNYRSRAEIVRASLAVIEENKDRFVKQLRAASECTSDSPACTSGSPFAGREKSRAETGTGAVPPGAGYRSGMPGGTGRTEKGGALEESDGTGPVSVYAFSEKEAQYSHMQQAISRCLQQGESCAVLFRTNSYMQGFAARLKSADIPYEMKEKAASIYEHFIVQDIMAYLQIAGGEGNREQMLRIMNKPSRYISREAVGEGSVDLDKIEEYYRRAQIPEMQRDRVRKELPRFRKQLTSVKSFTLRPGINYILKAMGYEQYLKEQAGTGTEKWQEWQELLDWLKEDASKYSGVKEWKAFQEAYAKSLEQNKAQAGPCPQKQREGENTGRRESGGKVHLLTVHGAKGLEFDNVWIPDCNEKIFPHGTMPDESTVEEERRIFYVAMTRAKKNLELLYLTGTKERPRQPSRFLNPLFR